ncbi:MAG TPA: carbohydrate ABC transporter substrate-binding protein [Streptomyces sp.]|nr:carbohydrate ABC transporter substrate-binding protein [Streptomyces sp.]
MTPRFKLLVLVMVMLLLAGGVVVVAWARQDEREPVTILGTWTGSQEAAFESLLDGIGIAYDYQGTAAQREVLLSKVQSGDPPDIVIMPGLGELAEYAGQRLLKPLDFIGHLDRYDPLWKSADSGHPYWVPVKAGLKSIVWYRETADGAEPDPPEWCVGMGDDGPSGWPGTDWIEDLVLQREGRTAYESWALGKDGEAWRGRPVRDAWRAWVALLSADPRTREALFTDHRGAPGVHGLLFAPGSTCTHEHQGSFAPSFYGEEKANRARLKDSVSLLPGGEKQDHHEVTADFAALFSDREEARDLIDALSSQPVQEKWAEQPDVYSAHNDVTVGPDSDQVTKDIAERLRHGTRCLDASDVMPPSVRDAFYEAVLLTMARVADRKDVDVPGILKDIQRVQDSLPRRDERTAVAPGTVCSTNNESPGSH